MERMGQFVIREKDRALNVYRIIGYDFEKNKCIMKRISSVGGWKELNSSEDFSTLTDGDKVYTSKEAVEFVKNYIVMMQNVGDILTALEKGTSKKWPVASKHSNYQIELSHLYNALNNTLCTLYYVSKDNGTQAYKDYTKSLHNLRKRFYFYYGDDGKQFVDYMKAIATGTEKTLKDTKMFLHLSVQRSKSLLFALEDYIRRVPEIKYIS